MADKRQWLARRCGLRLAVGHRRGGLEILTAPTVEVEHRSHRLLYRYPRLPQRALATALLRQGRHRIAVAVSHLDLCARARYAHAAQLLVLLRTQSAPTVLAVDVNEQPGGPAWQLLATSLGGRGRPQSHRRRADLPGLASPQPN